MVLVLIKPFVAIISQQLVLAKGCVHKTIHKRRGQVHAGRIHLRATAPKPCIGGRRKAGLEKDKKGLILSQPLRILYLCLQQ